MVKNLNLPTPTPTLSTFASPSSSAPSGMELNFQTQTQVPTASKETKPNKLRPPKTHLKNKPTAAKFVGVRQRPSGRWVAEIKDTTHKIRMWLGTFETAEAAARAYDEAACLLRGSNTRTNFATRVPYSHNSPLASRIRNLLNHRRQPPPPPPPPPERRTPHPPPPPPPVGAVGQENGPSFELGSNDMELSWMFGGETDQIVGVGEETETAPVAVNTTATTTGHYCYGGFMEPTEGLWEHASFFHLFCQT